MVHLVRKVLTWASLLCLGSAMLSCSSAGTNPNRRQLTETELEKIFLTDGSFIEDVCNILADHPQFAPAGLSGTLGGQGSYIGYGETTTVRQTVVESGPMDENTKAEFAFVYSSKGIADTYTSVELNVDTYFRCNQSAMVGEQWIEADQRNLSVPFTILVKLVMDPEGNPIHVWEVTPVYE